jgi:phosphomannomutase
VGFAVKELDAAGGVVITASHNPPEYNGYKVYWENAVQIAPPVDARIAAAIDRAPAARDIARPPTDSLREAGLLVEAPRDLEARYLAAIRSLAVHPEQGDRGISIVYTPLHGVGNSLLRRALAEARFVSVTSVPEQQEPDGAFPTVAFPNPEEPGAMDRALALAARLKADLVLANDPDADRLAVAVPLRGGYVRLTGNEVGALLGHYLLTEKRHSPRSAVVASIVSSPLVGRMAADLGVAYEETLTGFKWIAKRAIELERDGVEFVFGYEEALGYCIGNVVHDKDGISAAVLVAEIAAVLRSRGQTLATQLDAIARRWGLYTSRQVSLTRKGAEGAVAIRAMMTALRAAPPRRIGDDEVVAVGDYETSTRVDLRSGGRSALALPPSNMLSFELASGGRVVARPSGTEPKAKFYFDVREPVAADESVALAAARARASIDRLAVAFQAIASP